MKNQIHFASDSEARGANALSIICQRGVRPGLLLAACCALLTDLSHPARAAVTEAWVHRYSNVLSNANDKAVKIVRDAAGDVIVTGSTDDGIHGQDMLTIKYSGADGLVIWQKRYNGPANSDDQAQALAVDASGNVVVTGSSDGTNYSTDYYTVKYAAADGALLWQKRGPNGSVIAVTVDVSGNVVVTGDSATIKYLADGTGVWTNVGGRALAVDGSGNVVVTGTSGDDYYTAKYAAADGALLWEKRGPNGSLVAVAVDGGGNAVVTGSSSNGTNPDYYTAKYAAADGALLWERRYNGPANDYDEAQAVAVDGSGNVAVTGYSYGGIGSRLDFYTARYAAADGALLWEQRYNDQTDGRDHDEGRAVAVDGSGNVVVTGVSGWANGFGIYLDYYTAKYASADGALLWEKRYAPTSNNDVAQALTVDGSGNVVVTGFSYGGIGSGIDFYTAKYAAVDGALLWEQRYNGGVAKNNDEAHAVAVDGNGNIVVTGGSAIGSDDGSPSYDYYTAKYAAADGALLWEKRYHGPANSEDYANAVLVDGSGNVIVTGPYATIKYLADGTGVWTNNNGRATALAVDGNGNVVVTGSSSTIYTAKYAAADGALLWERRYNGPVSYYDAARAIVVDGSGNVVVTGYSYNTNFNSDYYTAKYAAADGALLWERRYNGPANSEDHAKAVAVDGSGNVVVTGGFVGTNNGYGNYYTAKYAAADGALLWEKRGPNGDASAVAVDGSGNVVVTGSSQGTDSFYDSYTAKYAAADGALLWEKRSNVPGDDRATAVALDGNGNAVVTGYSVGSGGNYHYHYYTAKYAAADGALLWEQRYNGPTNGDDYASSLALGPNGMVAVTGTSSRDYATVVYWENLPPVAIERVPTGIRLRFTGVPGRSYNIERAPAVTGPWSTLVTPTAPPGGLIEYVDTNAPAAAAFYRTSAP